MASTRFWLLLAGLLLALRTQAMATTDCQNHITHVVVDYGEIEYHRGEATFSDSQSARGALLKAQERDSVCGPVTSTAFEGFGCLANDTEIDEALRSLPSGLEDIHWNLQKAIPTSTVQVIKQHHPSARLHYNMPFYSWDERCRSTWTSLKNTWLGHDRLLSLRSILGSPNLYSLKVDLPYGTEDLPDDLPLVHEVLTTCNNLRELELGIRYVEVLKISGRYNLESEWVNERQGHFMARPSSYMYRPWSWLPDNVLDTIWPGVDTLGGVNVTAYEEATQIYTSGGRLRTPEEPTNLDAWMTRMDWSGLRTLKLDSAQQRTLETLGPVLSNLTELDFGSGSSPAAAVFPTFLRNLTTPLTRLTLHDYDFQDNYTALMDTLGETSGAHLTSLSITEHQWHQHRYCSTSDNSDELCPRGGYYLDRPYLNSMHLFQLARMTPNITNLDLDIARVTANATDQTTWTLDYSTIQAAAMMPQLRNLTLRLVSPDHFATLVGIADPRDTQYGPRHKNFKEPSLNRTSVPALFRDLNKRRVDSGLNPLAQLEIKTGMWDKREDDWGMMGAPYELIGRWLCQSSGRSEQSGPCFGGNSGLQGPWVRSDMYFEDWSQPDPKPKLRCWEEDLKHNEL